MTCERPGLKEGRPRSRGAPGPKSVGDTFRRGVLSILLVATCVFGLGAEGARGDACSQCGPPTTADLEADPAYKLDVRNGDRDWVEMDGGECTVQLEGAPVVTCVSAWLVLRAKGEAWSCPHSKSSDTIQVSTTKADTRAWELSGSLSIGGSVLGVGLGATITHKVSRHVQLATSVTITKTLTPAWCHRIAWEALFVVGEYTATVDVSLSRRWAWWTKSIWTGFDVQRQGNVWLDCGRTTAVLDALAPISGYYHLMARACQDEACKGKVTPADLGYFPPLPPGVQPPVTAPDGGPAGGVDDADANAADDDTQPEEGEAPPPVDEGAAGEGEECEPAPPEDGQAAEEGSDDPPSSDELPDPPAGIPPEPFGTESGADDDGEGR